MLRLEVHRAGTPAGDGRLPMATQPLCGHHFQRPELLLQVPVGTYTHAYLYTYIYVHTCPHTRIRLFISYNTRNAYASTPTRPSHMYVQVRQRGSHPGDRRHHGSHPHPIRLRTQTRGTTHHTPLARVFPLSPQERRSTSTHQIPHVTTFCMYIYREHPLFTPIVLPPKCDKMTKK